MQWHNTQTTDGHRDLETEVKTVSKFGNYIPVVTQTPPSLWPWYENVTQIS